MLYSLAVDGETFLTRPRGVRERRGEDENFAIASYKEGMHVYVGLQKRPNCYTTKTITAPFIPDSVDPYFPLSFAYAGL